LDNKKVSPGCSWKWEFLLFNVKSGYATMCCDHDGDRADLNSISKDISVLINSQSMINDRQSMLAGESLPNCQRCYRHITENTNIGGTMYENYNDITTSGKLKSLGIMLNTTCLYTCVYCTEHFSSSWYSDIEKNGAYQLHNQSAHNLSTLDKVQHKISIVDVKQSRYYDALRELLKSDISDELSTLRIGGGEPLLYETLRDFIYNTQSLRPNLSIEIYTGLGVSENIFEQFLKDTADIKTKLKIVLSQESVGPQAEFMRYGTNWSKWESMANRLLELGYHIEFNSVLNIISLFTMQDFLRWKHDSLFKNCISRIQPLKGPAYMSLQPLDEVLHTELLYKLLNADINFIASDYIPDYKNFERENLRAYLTEFSRRRNIDLSVLPKDFLNFLNE
jgi:hypothetical protein